MIILTRPFSEMVLWIMRGDDLETEFFPENSVSKMTSERNRVFKKKLGFDHGDGAVSNVTVRPLAAAARLAKR